MKEYEVFSTTGSAIAPGGTHSGTVTLENVGRNLNYALFIKGTITSADVKIDVTIPDDADTYETQLKGQSNLTALDINTGEARSTHGQTELAILRVAEAVTITVTNNDAGAGDATVKILQYEGPSG